MKLQVNSWGVVPDTEWAPHSCQFSFITSLSHRHFYRRDATKLSEYLTSSGMLYCLRFPHILQITKHSAEESIYVQNITLMKGPLEYADPYCQAPEIFDGTCPAHLLDYQFYAPQHLFHCLARNTKEFRSCQVNTSGLGG